MIDIVEVGGMAIEPMNRNQQKLGSNMLLDKSEQRSVSESEISNPLHGAKDQLSESPMLSPSSSIGTVAEQADEQVTSPLTSAEVNGYQQHQRQQHPHSVKSQQHQYEPSTTKESTTLPKIIDRYNHAQQHTRSSSSNSNNNNNINKNTNDSRKLFVGGLPKDVTAEEFYMYFAQYGEIIDSFIVYDRATSKPRGFGFVTFTDPDVCRQLLNIYEKENYSISEDDVVGWNEDAETIDGSLCGVSRPPSTRLQMRGRFIELKVAQPRDINTTGKQAAYLAVPRPTRPNGYHQPAPPRYYPHHNFNDCSSYDGEFDDMNKFSATLSHHGHHHQQQRRQQQQHHYPHQRPTGYGYMNTPVPMTPGGPLGSQSHHHHQQQQPLSQQQQQQRYNQTPLMTPATPAQAALDIAHHMIFYAQLLATPSMVSGTAYDDMHYYHEQILRTEDTESVAGINNNNNNNSNSNNINNYVVPSQPPPRPCTPSLSVPDVIVSPSKKKLSTTDVFTIGGGTFYPEPSLTSSLSPTATTTTAVLSPKTGTGNCAVQLSKDSIQTTTTIPVV